MRSKRSLNRTFLFCQMLVAAVSIVLMGSIWIYSQYSQFQQEARTMREDYLASQRFLIKSEVDRMVDYIRFMQAQKLGRLKSSIRNRVYEAHAIAQHLYEAFRKEKPAAEIRSMIKETLRPVRFNRGRGYYFINDLNGTNELFADHPEMEGVDLRPVRGGGGESVVPDMMRIARDSGEGFYEYAWSKPGREDNVHYKMAFVKLFEPYQWILGTGEYLEDVEEDIQLESLERIERVKFGKDGYFFAAHWDGTGIAGPGKGANVLDIRDKDGIYIVREFIKLSQKGGGYLEYVMPPMGQVKSAPKMSYVTGIEEWQWYIGAGVFIDEIEMVLQEKKLELDKRVENSIQSIGCILLGIIFLAIGVSFYTTRKVGDTLKTFSSFFRNTAQSLVPIDAGAVGFSEFQDLVSSANQMIHERKRVEDIHKLDELRLEALLRLNHMTDVTLREIAYHAMEEAVRLTQSEVGYIAFMNREQTVLTMYAWSESAMEGCRIENKPLDYPVESTGLWGEAVRQRRPVITNDYAANNPWKKGTPEGHIEIRRHMNIPLIDRDQIVIVAGVGNKAAPYDESDVRQLTLLMSGMWSIVQRRRAEEATRKSEETLRTIFAAAENVSFIITDIHLPEPLVQEFSPGAERIFGYSREEIVGKPVSSLHVQQDVRQFPQIIERMRGRKEGFGGEVTLVRKTGETFPALFNTYPLFNDQGEMYAALGVSIDISERRRLEAQLRQAQKLEAIGTLAGGIAHDFNNMLAPIIGYAEMGLNTLSRGHPLHHDLEQILTAATRARDLVKQILAFSHHGQEQERTVQDISVIVREALVLMKALLPASVEIRQEFQKGMALVDATQVHQVVINLCTNAAHAMPDGGKLEVRLKKVLLSKDDLSVQAIPNLNPGAYLELNISDTGHGMDGEILGRIFDPYFTTKETGKGSGLGLAMVHGIVKRHQGAITVRSRPGKGSKFTIYLPNVEGEEDLVVDSFELLPSGSEHILFVDDERILVELGARMLAELGYRVTTETDSLKALDVFHSSPGRFDLVLTDYTMPHMSGADLAREILRTRPGIPVILCTGFSESINEETVKGMGIREFVMKPLQLAQLAKLVRKVLDRAE